MAEQTTNYGLVKPAPDEFYDVNVPNGNMDIIDTKLKELEDKGDLTQIEQELSELETKFTQHSGDKIAHITSQERSKWNTAEQTVTQNKDSWSWNGNKVLDTRTHKATISYYRSFPWMTRTHYEFKNPSDVDLGAEYFINADNYASVETFVPWSDTSGGGIV